MKAVALLALALRSAPRSPAGRRKLPRVRASSPSMAPVKLRPSQCAYCKQGTLPRGAPETAPGQRASEGWGKPWRKKIGEAGGFLLGLSFNANLPQ